ncbi:MAG: class IV adenylate cyclase [Planctomycetota bacterium]
MLEVEQKYRVSDSDELADRLIEIGATAGTAEQHADTYYRHPCRDFVQTGEAFRVRRINEVASVTYKGPKLNVADETLKAREEIEWCLAPGDSDGTQMERLLVALGFEAVTTVAKQRVSYRWPDNHDSASFTVTIDCVEKVGTFAEIEQLVETSDGLDSAATEIATLANQLNLSQRVRESYLELLLNVL